MPGVERAFAAWQARPHDCRPLVMMDFDGTLVDFDVDPDDVWLPEARRQLLQTIARRSDLSGGLISGRRLTDLRERAGAGSSLFYAGLHGLEIEGPGLRFMHHAASAAAPTIGVLVAEARAATDGLAGVIVEDKGLSVTLHVRGASKADRLHAMTWFDALAEPAARDGLRASQRRMTELPLNIDWARRRPASDYPSSEAGRASRFTGRDDAPTATPEEIGDGGLTIVVSNQPAPAFASPTRPRRDVPAADWQLNKGSEVLSALEETS